MEVDVKIMYKLNIENKKIQYNACITKNNNIVRMWIWIVDGINNRKEKKNFGIGMHDMMSCVEEWAAKESKRGIKMVQLAHAAIRIYVVLGNGMTSNVRVYEHSTTCLWSLDVTLFSTKFGERMGMQAM